MFKASTITPKHLQLAAPKLKVKQECIPVGCVPSAAVAISWGGGQVLPRGCLPRGVYPGGVWLGVSA